MPASTPETESESVPVTPLSRVGRGRGSLLLAAWQSTVIGCCGASQEPTPRRGQINQGSIELHKLRYWRFNDVMASDWLFDVANVTKIRLGLYLG